MGGTAVSWTLRGTVHDNKRNKNRVMYWNDGEETKIDWKDNSIVIIKDCFLKRVENYQDSCYLFDCIEVKNNKNIRIFFRD
ncbi:DUF5412 family protein [Metabacillus fastidiosus]|uniref:DUF5412 family protein n=1 Tax=Metabacillus fastidiosus TaxID=1458 RepID=UPI003D27CB64